MNRNPDIEALKQEVKRLKEENKNLQMTAQHYRNIFNDSEDAYYELDLSGSFTYFNDTVCRILGYSRNEIMGMNNLTYTTAETAQVMYAIFNSVYQTGRPARVNDYEVIRKDGKIIIVELSVSLMRNPDGTIIGFTGVGRDKTERRKAERALSIEKAYLEQLFESSPEAIVVVDNNGHLLRVNGEFTRMFGYTRSEAIGRPIDELIAPEDLIEEALSLTKDVTQGKLISLETIRRRKDGGTVHVSILATPIEAEGGQIAVYGIYRDISERKNLEARLQQAQKMEAIGTLAGGIAHDFNNLLMGIQGRTSLMLMDVDQTHPHYHHLKQQEEIVRSGADLTRQLLGFARGGKYEARPANINDIVDQSSEMFRRTKKEITIYKKYCENICTVKIDQGQMEQVFVNIFINAWQSMPGEGKVYIETDNSTVTEKVASAHGVATGEYVKISITDTGVGMDEATRDRIFEPFFTTKEMGRGTGLGLASVYGIIKNHDGFIDVKSEKGRGTTFTVYLPAVSLEMAVKEIPERGKIVMGTETILLVDDEDMILGVGSETLKKLGYTVIIARNGKEAVDIVRDAPDRFDLIILDMIMPEMGGGEALKIIKSIKPDAKILLASGYSLHATANEIINEGSGGFIQKPFSIEDLSKK